MGYDPNCSTCKEIKSAIERDTEDVRRATARLESLLASSIIQEAFSLVGMNFAGASGVAKAIIGQIGKAAIILVGMGKKALADQIKGISSDITRAEDEQKKYLDKQRQDIERQKSHAYSHS